MPDIDTRSEATTSRAWWCDFSAWGGLLAACGGFFHTVTAAVVRREVWARIVDDGFPHTVTSDPSPDRLAVAEAFWFGPGSFGVPLLLLGALVTWLVRRGAHVPGWLGWGVGAWAVLLGLLGGFDTGTITLLLIGVLLVVGALRSPSGGTSARRGQPRWSAPRSNASRW
ncbi:DUF6463 family protein [Actinosynnema sp. NPDC050801]|uniref:DUF6463 family protein n=1 Tax=unclassified Actinosynnema TaxID=2637065 RepID=UPI0033D70B96